MNIDDLGVLILARANAIKEGKEPISESVVIADANGQELMSVPLTQALPNRFRD